VTHEEFLTQLGKKALKRLLEPFLASGSVNCFQVLDKLQVAQMSQGDGETLGEFRERWFNLVDRALGCKVDENGVLVIMSEGEDNEAAFLIKATFGEDALAALRYSR